MVEIGCEFVITGVAMAVVILSIQFNSVKFAVYVITALCGFVETLPRLLINH